MARKYFLSGSPYEKEYGFSRVMRVGNTIYVAGTAPIAADGKTAAPGDVAGQTRCCFEIVKAALEEAGAIMDEVVRTRMYITDASFADAVGQVHNEFFALTRPVATMVVVSGLVREDFLVEVEVDCVTKE
jgi:enamine deaminase RidA (YjgF/YER057c/UK114 family)